jgi:prolyl oligopeptidase
MDILRHPPFTLESPVAETLHNIELVDPYRWLENPDSESTRQWIAEQGAYTALYLDSIPERALVRQRVATLLDVETIADVWQVGGRFFCLKRAVHEEQPSIVVRGDLGGPDVVLVSPPRNRMGNVAALQILKVSGSGKLLAFGIRSTGADTQSVGFVDVENRQVLPDNLPEGFGPGLVFTEDPAGFYYTHEVLDTTDGRRAVLWHRFGTPLSEDREIFVAGRGPHVHVGVIGSSDGHILAYLRFSSDSSRKELFVHDIQKNKNTIKLLEAADFTIAPFFVNRTLCAVTNLRAPNFRVVRIDVERPESEYWKDVVPESTRQIGQFAAAPHHICVKYVDDAQTSIEIFDLEGTRTSSNPCPPMGTASLFTHAILGEIVFYTFSSFLQAPTLYAIDVRTGAQRIFWEQDVEIDRFRFEVERVTYPSRDGVEIPMFLVSNKRIRSAGPMPTFITGYGGFGACSTPKFNAYSTFLIEQGFLFGVTKIRGGGEFGPQWHEAAKRHNRQKAFDDFISAAEWLIKTGRAIPNKIAIGGGSNGGLLVAVAMTQRPELYRAVICLGPLLDMLRYHLFDSASSYANEFGTAEDETDFRHLYAYSPYQRVEKGVSYPAVLLISGDADTRCNPMHVRKMVAALQSASSSNRAIVMQYEKTWGHSPMQPLRSRINALTNRLSFVCHELGITLSQTASVKERDRARAMDIL